MLGFRVCRLRPVLLTWWQMLALSRDCPYTTAILTRAGRFEAAARAFLQGEVESAEPEQLAAGFLQFLARDADPLVAAVAATEAALQEKAARDRRIRWPQDPDPVFAYLERGEPFPQDAGAPFMVAVGAEGMVSWPI
ncbi:MAG: hypothetical protein JO264_15100 [Acidisphaera sp.]|nr:hypothetical protein [Acidisphaera sp.]